MNFLRFFLAALPLALAASAALGQGSLTPPGAPAPTMKTLDQVEARTPIAASTSTVTIFSDGSYYLTGNIAVASGDGIDINANNATLDLNGFTISSSATTAGGTAVNFAGTGSVVIHNGRIRSNTTADTSTGVFTTAGFSAGITVGATATSARIEDLDISGIGSDGIYTSSANAVISQCQVNIASNYGISTSGTVTHCVASSCGYTAIIGNVVSDCKGTSFNGMGVSGNTATNCFGLTRDLSANSSLAGVYAAAVTNCSGSGYGLAAGVGGVEIRGSYGVANETGNGIAATVVSGCYGSTSTGTGISANIVTDSYGGAQFSPGTGIAATAAINSTGMTGGGTGLQCKNAATNCVGISNGNNSTAIGLDCGTTGVATGCTGTAGGTTGYSIKAKIANGCALGTGITSILHNVNSF